MYNIAEPRKYETDLHLIKTILKLGRLNTENE